MQESYLAKDLQKINAINTLLRQLSANQIVLPAITVIGCQSIGKTSMIQQLISLDLLQPIRTSTWRPLEIHFNHTPHSPNPYAAIDQIIENGQPKIITNFKQIPQLILKASFQFQVSRSIGTHPIHLRIYSKSSPTLTIVDTPGFVFIKINNPTNLRQISSDIITNYVNQPQTIILTVLPPTLEHSGRVILPFATKADPTQKRTLPCITKIDIMDRGTDAVAMLQNRELPMRCGYVGVKNRGQHDRNESLSVKQALEKEIKYFENSPIYCKLPRELWGTDSLSRKIKLLIYQQIKPQFRNVLAFINLKKTQMKAKQESQNASNQNNPYHEVLNQLEAIFTTDAEIMSVIQSQDQKEIQLPIKQKITSNLFSEPQQINKEQKQKESIKPALSDQRQAERQKNALIFKRLFGL